jgi:hypothetical protein
METMTMPNSGDSRGNTISVPYTPNTWPNTTGTWLGPNPRITELEIRVEELKADLDRERALSGRYMDIIIRLLDSLPS